MDEGVIKAKLESPRRFVARVEAHCRATADELAKDIDAQDIIALNLSRVARRACTARLVLLAKRKGKRLKARHHEAGRARPTSAALQVTRAASDT